VKIYLNLRPGNTNKTMTQLQPNISSDLDGGILHYSEALSEFEQAAPQPTEEQALNILLARDGVAAALNERSQPSKSSIATLVGLDERLKQQQDAIANAAKLED
jgi:hypothetical protein